MTTIDLACQVGLLKAVTLLICFSCSLFFLSVGLQAAECFMGDFPFPNVIFPINVNNAPFPGSVPVDVFATKLTVEF